MTNPIFWAELADALGAQVGSAAVNVLSLQLQLAAANQALASAQAHIEQMDSAVADREARIRLLEEDRDAWRSKVETHPCRPIRAPRKAKA